LGANLKFSFKQKADYIEALGISVWLPRLKLVNAKPAIQLKSQLSDDRPERPQLSEKETIPSISEVVASLPISADVSAPGMPIIKGPLVNNSEKESAKIKNTEADRSAGSIRFGLALYVMNDWIVCSSLTSDYNDFEHSATQLITNILKVLGTSKPTLEHHHIISWPFFSNPNASQGIEPARLYVNGIIQHLVEQHQVSKLLVCGGVLAKLNHWSAVDGRDYNLDRLIIPSVYKMMDDPSEKAKAWQIIQNSKIYQAK